MDFYPAWISLYRYYFIMCKLADIQCFKTKSCRLPETGIRQILDLSAGISGIESIPLLSSPVYEYNQEDRIAAIKHCIDEHSRYHYYINKFFGKNLNGTHYRKELCLQHNHIGDIPDDIQYGG